MYTGRVYPAASMSVAYAYPPHVAGGVPAAMDGYGSMAGSFAFKKRFERIDWKKIASADIDSISRNLDFNALQDNIMNITFCNIESEVDTRLMDPNFLKLFKLAQLTIEYLLHSQDYLSSMVGSLEARVKKAVEEHEQTKKQMEKTQGELAEVKKECHKRKKMLVAQQQILQDGANAYNKCPYCSKAFINQNFLQSHLVRRHPEHAGPTHRPEVIQPQQQAMLATSQGQLNQERVEQLEKALQEMREMLSNTERQLTDERNTRNTNLQQERAEEESKLREQRAMLERMQAEQKQQHRDEMKTMEELFSRKLNEINTKYKEQTSTVEALQARLKSRPGEEVQHEMEELRKQREENAVLKENLQEQVQKMQSEMNKQMKQKERQLQEEMSSMQRKHEMQIEELNEALEQSTHDREQEAMQTQYKQTLKEATFVLEHTIEREKSQRQQQSAEKPVPSPAQNQSIKDQVQKATSPAQTGVGRMEPPSDDDTTELQEATTTMGTGGPSTLRTLQGTGSLSLNATRQAQLMEAVRKNPEFLRGMKQQLLGVFEDMLEKRGVKKGTTGLSTPDYNNKSSILKQERQQKAQKLPNYWDIRQQYINEVEHLSRQRLEQQRKHSGGSAPVKSLSSSAPLASGVARPRPQSAAQSHAPRGQSVQRSASESHARKPPVASPRNTLQSTKSTNRQSLDSQGDETLTSTQWESSEEEETEEETESEEETEGVDEVDARRTQPTASQRQAANQRPPQTANQRQAAGAGQPQRRAEESEDEEDESWDDDLSDLMDVPDPETPKQSGSRSQVRATSTPKGQNVARLSASIDEQLQGRGSKKPAGGVNTVNTQKQASDDDDDVSLESVSDMDIPSANPKPRQAATRSSTHTNYSTDTYGTSAWGTGSKAASTVHGGGQERLSVNKSVSKASTSGDVEVSDWDSDDAMDIKDL